MFRLFHFTNIRAVNFVERFIPLKTVNDMRSKIFNPTLYVDYKRVFLAEQSIILMFESFVKIGSKRCWTVDNDFTFLHISGKVTMTKWSVHKQTLRTARHTPNNT